MFVYYIKILFCLVHIVLTLVGTCRFFIHPSFALRREIKRYTFCIDITSFHLDTNQFDNKVRRLYMTTKKAAVENMDRKHIEEMEKGDASQVSSARLLRKRRNRINSWACSWTEESGGGSNSCGMQKSKRRNTADESMGVGNFSPFSSSNQRTTSKGMADAAAAVLLELGDELSDEDDCAKSDQVECNAGVAIETEDNIDFTSLKRARVANNIPQNLFAKQPVRRRMARRNAITSYSIDEYAASKIVAKRENDQYLEPDESPSFRGVEFSNTILPTSSCKNNFGERPTCSSKEMSSMLNNDYHKTNMSSGVDLRVDPGKTVNDFRCPSKNNTLGHAFQEPPPRSKIRVHKQNDLRSLNMTFMNEASGTTPHTSSCKHSICEQTPFSSENTSSTLNTGHHQMNMRDEADLKNDLGKPVNGFRYSSENNILIHASYQEPSARSETIFHQQNDLRSLNMTPMNHVYWEDPRLCTERN